MVGMGCGQGWYVWMQALGAQQTTDMRSSASRNQVRKREGEPPGATGAPAKAPALLAHTVQFSRMLFGRMQAFQAVAARLGGAGRQRRPPHTAEGWVRGWGAARGRDSSLGPHAASPAPPAPLPDAGCGPEQPGARTSLAGAHGALKGSQRGHLSTIMRFATLTTTPRSRPLYGHSGGFLYRFLQSTLY